MNKKSFIITALVMNLTICLTMCVIVFTGKDNKSKETKVVESTSIDEIKNTETEEKTTHKKNNSETTTINKTETTGDNHSTIIERPAETTNPNEHESETTTAHEVQNAVVSGSTTVTSSCNVHTEAEVDSPVVGSTSTGVVYSVDASKSNDNWVAIVFNGEIGYISTGYCQMQ